MPSEMALVGRPCSASGVGVAVAVGRLVAEERDRVAHRRESDPEHDRVLRLVDELVDRAPVEARRTVDLDLRVADVTPLQVVRPLALRILRRSHRQHAPARLERGSRIRQPPAGNGLGVIEDELLERRADNRRAVGIVRHRQVGDDVRLGRHQVALPSDPDEGEAALEQRRLGRSGPASVGDRVIERPVPAGHVDRPVDLDRRPVFDPPSRIAGCVREVHDVLVAGIRRIDLTGNCAAQQLVLADIPEGPTAERRRFHDVQIERGDLRQTASRRQQARDDRDDERAFHVAHDVSRLR